MLAEKLSFPPPLPLSASRVHQQCDYNRLIGVIFGAFFLFQEKVLHNVMSIFTFMGASVVRQDDSYSFEVITKTLDTVIPALIQVCVVCLKLSVVRMKRNMSKKRIIRKSFSIECPKTEKNYNG